MRPSFQTTNSLLVQFDKCSGNRRPHHGFLSEIQWEFHFPCVEKNRTYVVDTNACWNDIIAVVRVTSNSFTFQISTG